VSKKYPKTINIAGRNRCVPLVIPMLMPQALSTMIMAQMAFKYMNDLICISGGRGEELWEID
jgi:hypothetical protein